MASFEIAIGLTLQNEGGYCDNSSDPGGATNMGIEQRDLPNIPIQTLTVEQATEYYLTNYVKPLYAQINDQSILNKLIDCGVLFGVGEAVEQLQGVLAVTIDGQFGPMTLQAVNTAAGSLLASYKTAMLRRATAIVNANPALGLFLLGWTRRINS